MILRQLQRLARSNSFTRPIGPNPPSNLRHVPIVSNVQRSRFNSIRTSFTYNLNGRARVVCQLFVPFTHTKRRHLIQQTNNNGRVGQRLYIVDKLIANRVLLSRLNSHAVHQLRLAIRQRRHTMRLEVAQTRLHNTNTALQRTTGHPRLHQLNRERVPLDPRSRVLNRVNLNVTLNNINARTIVQHLAVLIKRGRS